jgi:hypothetical protein
LWRSSIPDTDAKNSRGQKQLAEARQGKVWLPWQLLVVEREA